MAREVMEFSIILFPHHLGSNIIDHMIYYGNLTYDFFAETFEISKAKQTHLSIIYASTRCAVLGRRKV